MRRPASPRLLVLPLGLALAACAQSATGLVPLGEAGSSVDGGLVSVDAAGPLCPTAGTFCGSDGVSGGDPSTLYYCPGKARAPSSSMICSNGCQIEGTGLPDQCKAASATSGGLSCPGGGLYCGSDGLTGGDPSTLYDCPGAGMAPSSSTACAHGCQVEPAGTNDYCSGAIVCPGSGAFCGSDGVTGGDPSSLYACPGSGMAPTSSMPCSAGCDVKPAGTPDACKTTLSCPGSGAYCGSDGVAGGDGNTLYQCPGSGEAPSSSMACSTGCQVEPAGTNDFCAATNKCPGSGAYCGNDMLGGPANVLYDCSGSGATPGSPMVCSGGCTTEPAGTPDVCSGGACSTLGQAALNWEANQLNSGNSWSDYCLGFVNNAFAAAGDSPWYLHEPDANTSLNEARTTGSFHNWDGTCPCGAIIYWSANSCNGEWGHVAICNGDGTVSTSGWPGFGGSSHASITWLDGEECGYTPAGWILPG